MPRSARAYPKGIRRVGDKLQAYLTYRGKFHSQTYPLSTPIRTLQDWRERKRSELKYGTPAAADRKFPADAARYLKLVAHMPSKKDRTYHIDQWAIAFHDRVRSELAALDIREQLEEWRTSGRFDGEGLSVASLNRRRTALMAMFTVLDGKSAKNIVKDVPKYDESDSHQDRSQPMLTVAKVMRHVPVKSKARAQLRVLQWTGWPGSLAFKVKETDVRWDTHKIRVPPRKKAKGKKAELVKVMRRAIVAYRLLFRRGHSKYDGSSLHSTWHRACERAGVRPFRVYDIKHSFGAWAAPLVKDNDTLRDLMRTNSIDRYTEGARMARMESGVLAMQGRRRIQGDSGGSDAGATDANDAEKPAGNRRKTA